jgi:hypothetical protein
MRESFEKLAMLQPTRAPVYDEVASLIAPTETPLWLNHRMAESKSKPFVIRINGHSEKRSQIRA